ncbi:glycosyltransferase [Vampirovibrio chlorellavorus]|uniref:glycosyltransferase n=1 Tax=Vampirovibrio chlorellavorus TaxID=758823 RepID=UPI0026EA95F6|nr:glycosyltransferase [Vampirovibrio chlorellavorus]
MKSRVKPEVKAQKVILLAHEHLYGGGTKQTFLLAEALVAKGVQTVLISNAEKTWLGQTIAQNGLPVKTYYSPLIDRAIRPWQELQVLFFIIKVFLKEKPDVVLASGVKLIGLSGVASWLCRVPGRFAIIRGEGAPPGSRTLKMIYLMHRGLALLGVRYITVSEYIRRQMMNGGICRPDRIHTIHDGIPIAEFANRSASLTSDTAPFAEARPPGAFKIGMVGRLVPGKRYDYFIQLMTALCREFPHVYGVLIGEGPDRPHLERLIQASGFTDRIGMAGYCADMPKVYGDLDFTVLFTDYEGCPNSVLESMAAGVPVLASDVCGMGEILESGCNGFLVKHGDVEGATALVRKVIENPAYCQSMSQNARDSVSRHFDASQKLQALASYLLGSNSS